MRLLALALLLIVCVPSVDAASRRAKPRNVKVMTMSATAYCQKGTTASGDHTAIGVSLTRATTASRCQQPQHLTGRS